MLKLCPCQRIASSSASKALRPAAPGATGSMSAAAARALAIAQRHDLPELLARILAGRNVEIDAVDAFLDPTIRRAMPDPHVLAGMKEAAARMADGVTRGETIAIFGDYDVDGATSAALLARYLRHCGIEPLIHIPDRLFEGYGPNVEAVRALAERGATPARDRRLRHHQHRAAERGACPRHGCRRHRPPSGR